MAIVKTVNFYNFERAFIDAGRKDSFSYEGKRILFDYLENLSDDLGEPIELDVIALCCDYQESSLLEIVRDYGRVMDNIMGITEDQLIDGEITGEDIIEALQEYTSVCGMYYCEEIEDDIIVFQSF